MSRIVTVDSSLSGLGISFWEADTAYSSTRGCTVMGGSGGKEHYCRATVLQQRAPAVSASNFRGLA